MKNREYVNAYFKDKTLKGNILLEEIHYRMHEVDREELEDEAPYDFCDALLDTEDFAENLPLSSARLQLLKLARKELIKLGRYREISDAELAQYHVYSSGYSGPARALFKLEGKKYWSDDADSVWPEKERQA